MEQEGPLLITHQGLSGPAALRLSAFAARNLHDVNYRATLYVHWAPVIGETPTEIFHALSTQIKFQWTKKFVTTQCPWPQANIPKRLWSALVQAAGIPESTTWSQVSNGLLQELSRYIAACPIHMTGKNRFADEFVTAGGLNLKQIDMTTMQSKLHPGLFVCGEILDVDGITGGYNFMNCWSTGYVAGCAAVHHVLDQQQQQQEQSFEAATEQTPLQQHKSSPS
jgi:predicted Rossmann fold flavoprotein